MVDVACIQLVHPCLFPKVGATLAWSPILETLQLLVTASVTNIGAHLELAPAEAVPFQCQAKVVT